MADSAASQSRWLRFSLWLVLACAVLASAWFAARVEQARKQREVIVKIGGSIVYDYQGLGNSGAPRRSSDDPPNLAWLRKMLSDDFFSEVVAASVHRDAEMAHLGGLTHLQFLTLYGPGITDAGLEHLGPLPRLQTLRIFDTQVTDAGLEHLSALSQLQTLTIVYIVHMPHITERGLESLRQLPQLRRLNLWGGRVTAADVTRLKQALPNCQIDDGR